LGDLSIDQEKYQHTTHKIVNQFHGFPLGYHSNDGTQGSEHERDDRYIGDSENNIKQQ
jgi:hypothetical protein